MRYFLLFVGFRLLRSKAKQMPCLIKSCGPVIIVLEINHHIINITDILKNKQDFSLYEKTRSCYSSPTVS